MLIETTDRWRSRWSDFYRFEALIAGPMEVEDILCYINHGLGDTTPDDHIKQLRQEDILKWLTIQQ